MLGPIICIVFLVLLIFRWIVLQNLGTEFLILPLTEIPSVSRNLKKYFGKLLHLLRNFHLFFLTVKTLLLSIADDIIGCMHSFFSEEGPVSILRNMA